MIMKIVKKCMVIGLSMLLAASFYPTVAAKTSTATLEGDRLLFVGDSIAAGWRDTGHGHADKSAGGGWALRLEKEYGMKVMYGALPSQSVLSQVRSHKYDEPYKIVILQGGLPDYVQENASDGHIPPLGTVTATTDGTGFDMSTFSGTFEEFLYYAKNDYRSAKMGYIINYKTPLSSYGITNGQTKTAEGYTLQDYIDRQKELCDKWGIPYLDLWSGTASNGKKYSGDIIKVNADGVHFPGGADNYHLNAAGYDASMPYIAQWIADLKAGTLPTTTTTKYQPAPTTTTTTKAKPVTTTTTTTAAAVGGDAVTTTTTTTAAAVGGDTVTTTTTLATAPTQDAGTPAPQTQPAPVGLILGIVIGAVALVGGALVTIILIQRKKRT